MGTVTKPSMKALGRRIVYLYLVILIACLCLAASRAPANAAGATVYRGLNVAGNGTLNLTPGAFRFNPNLSLVDRGLTGLPGAPTHACFLAINLRDNVTPNQSTYAVDFPFTVFFDNDPAGHYSMLQKEAGNGAELLSSMLKTLKARRPGEYDLLIVDGSTDECYELEANFGD